MFNGVYESFRAYMIAQKMSPSVMNAILNNAKEEFTKILDDKETGLKAQYHDPLCALIAAKSKIITCFAEVNDDIGLIAAVEKLKVRRKAVWAACRRYNQMYGSR